jgi:acetylornithine deacetylase/succinyl-diaminopimelate desuccinylase-like protein
MTGTPSSGLSYAQDERARFVAELKQFVAFPSVSAQPERKADVRRCAEWLATHLRGAGLDHVRIVPTAGHPIVYADWLRARGRPTVLVYGHYDVQPADPLAAWQSPPFEPTLRGENLHGRGASDDKGQMFTHVKAIESLLRATGTLPVNVKCLFKGEEEIGSTHLLAFLRRHGEAMTADIAVLSDNRMLGPDRPVITESLRGGLSVELEVFGQGHDLHSGNFGGAVHNPLQALCEILVGLHDAGGRIAIPGLYDRVRQLSARERTYMRGFGPSDAAILADASAQTGWGEAGYTLYERTTIRPALTINGLTGGYQGPGTKAVIPSRASAKLNFRLVPDQDPLEIDRLLRAHVARIAPPTVRTAIRTDLAVKPAVTERNHPAVSAAAAAYQKGFGAAPVFVRSGGTIPVVNHLREILGIPSVLMGFALPDDGLHAPNEKFHLPTFFKAIATSIHFLTEVAGIGRQASRDTRGRLALPQSHDHGWASP